MAWRALSCQVKRGRCVCLRRFVLRRVNHVPWPIILLEKTGILASLIISDERRQVERGVNSKKHEAKTRTPVLPARVEGLVLRSTKPYVNERQ